MSFRDLSMDSDTINTVKHKQLFQDSYDTMLLTVITVRPNERPFNTCSKRMKRNANETEGGGRGLCFSFESESAPVALQRTLEQERAVISRPYVRAAAPAREREKGPCGRLARCVGVAAQRVTGQVLLQCHARAPCRRCSTPEGGLEAASR